MNDEAIAVTMPRTEQAVVCFLGAGTVLIARDEQSPNWDVTPAQRAVTVARLRAMADRLESAGEAS